MAVWYAWTTETSTNSSTTTASGTSTGDVWIPWNGTSGSTTVNVRYDATWKGWIDETDTYNTTYKAPASVWIEWTTGTDTNVPAPAPIIPDVRVDPTVVERERLVKEEWDRLATEQRRRMQEEAEKRERAQKEASAKAERLLLSVLNRRQRKEYLEKNTISIYERGKRKPSYVLKKDTCYNIKDYKTKQKHCVYLPGCPVEDTLAGEVLYLRHDPAALLARANHEPLTELAN